jgi:hypothetical protein
MTNGTRPAFDQILLFDNGDKNLRPYSTVVQIVPPLQPDGSYAFDAAKGYGPEAPDWQYAANPPESLFANIISSAQRLKSGDTLVCDGPAGHFFEVTPAGETVWSYVLTDTNGATGNLVFRAVPYDSTFAGLKGRTLVPLGALHLSPPT